MYKPILYSIHTHTIQTIPGSSELIGNIIERLNRVKKANMQSLDVQWYNMYGAPEFKQEKLLANVKKGVVAVG
ncbi:hypothetical protein EON63_13265 [archaeon]|nr:MAG: hypothetical protein EON63_13265 [archaeon]